MKTMKKRNRKSKKFKVAAPLRVSITIEGRRESRNIADRVSIEEAAKLIGWVGNIPQPGK
jgi:hypothetical protein